MGWVQAASDWLVETLDFLPDPLVIILLGFQPLGEVRLSIPVAIIVYGMGWGEAFVWSLIGNLFVAPAAAWLYPRFEAGLRKWGPTDRLIDRIYARTRRRSNARIERLEEAAVAVFIAIPLPGSGAWAGVLVAHVFGLEWSKAWRFYYAGVVGATTMVIVLVVTGTAFV